MKWIGQHIWDFISRFRSDVYLEDLTESAQDHVVGIDADGKLYKQDVATGDITGVTAGDGLTGGGSSGDVTINVGVGTGLDVAADEVQLDLTEVIASDGINRILRSDGDGTLTGSSKFTYDGSVVTIGAQVDVLSNRSVRWVNGGLHVASLNNTNGTTNRSLILPDASGTLAVSESTTGKQYWHHTFGGYKTSVNNTTGYYFQYRNGNDAWNNFDSSPSTLSQYDSYAGFLIAPRDGTIENVKIAGYTSFGTGGGGSGNEFAFYFKKAASSNDASSVALTDLFNTSDITPSATTNRTFSHTEDFSSSNSFSEGDVLYCFIRKTATAGTTNFYFTLTISGYW